MKSSLLLESLIESVLSEELLDEAAVSVDSLVSQGIALFVDDDGTNRDFIFYKPETLLKFVANNPKAKEKESLRQAAPQVIVGYMEIKNENLAEFGAWNVGYAAAVKGYGPPMYDIAMSSISPEFLSSDRKHVSQFARRVWAYYLTNRANEFYIKKMPSEGSFSDESNLGNDENLNYAFAIKQPVNFSSLVQKNEETMKTLQKTNTEIYRMFDSVMIRMAFQFYSSLKQ